MRCDFKTLFRLAGFGIVFLLLADGVSSAYPGGRTNMASWFYDNKLWLYGGNGIDEVNDNAGLLSDVWSYDITLDTWSFVAGNNLKDQPQVANGGVGEFSPTNSPGGLKESCTWIANNRLYAFGGTGPLGLLNDVWQFDADTNQWAHMQTGLEVNGSYSQPYRIGARGSAKCVVSPDETSLYVGGGLGYNSMATGLLNDVWRYNISENTWAFISGEDTLDTFGNLTYDQPPSSNEFPHGCRFNAAWWDSTLPSIYFCGGDAAFGQTNRLLRFTDGVLQEWTLLSTQGDLNPRASSGFVSNGAGKAWVFGGIGTASGNIIGYGLLADLLEWDGTTWTYLAGNRSTSVPGSYPALEGETNDQIFPGARSGAAMWIDGNNRLWLFGGIGYVNESSSGKMNDLWMYSFNTNQWTWVGGSQLADQNGNYTMPVVPIAAPVSPPLSPPTTPPIAPPTISEPVQPIAGVTAPQGLGEAETIAIAVVISAVAASAGLLLLLLLLKKQKKKKKARVQPSSVTDFNNNETATDASNAHYRTIALPDTIFGNYSRVETSNSMTSPTTASSNIGTGSSDNRLIPYASVTLEKEIGEGSFGKVFLGKLRTTKVAVKVANTNMAQDEFIREANFQLAIPPHPNIVQLLGISVDGPQPLVVLEFCNEGSLDRLLFKSAKVNTPAEQIALAEAIARGIDHLHQNSIVHRDLAVRNILLHRGDPKISDFGMSRKLKEASQIGKTATNIGPLRWMSPEALGQQLYSTKSDVWSFGMILYEIVAHQEPHEKDDLISVAIKIRDEGYTPDIPESCPPLLREIMQMCWKKDPNERPEMGTICAMLEKNE